VRFDAVELSVPDLEAARAFYAGVLQLAALPAASGLAFSAGPTRLALRAAPAEQQPRYHLAFSVPLARFDAARRLVAAHTPLITAGGDEVIVHASWDAVAFYFRDPAGSILECIARRGEPADDPLAPQAPAIGSVCEVGVVVDDVPAMAATLRGALRVAPFRGSEGETFTALGDSEGLLIVVQRGREWYPSTGLAAEPAPLQLAVTLDDGSRRRISGPPYRCDGA
jgi:catechol 2,3-dioxygenase-like lactoylglutathione lyase family enzyme